MVAVIRYLGKHMGRRGVGIQHDFSSDWHGNVPLCVSRSLGKGTFRSSTSRFPAAMQAAGKGDDQCSHLACQATGSTDEHSGH
jgi:hypothetical protein